MRKLFAIGLAVAIVSMAFATGEPERLRGRILGNAWDSAVIGKNYQAIMAAVGIDVELVNEDITTGSTISMDALVAAGKPPDLYYGFVGRSGKYMVPGFALEVSKYSDRIVPSYLDMFRRGDKLYGLPIDITIQGLCVNLDLLEKIGYKMPAESDWTIAEFLKMCEMAKAKGYYGTALFAKSQSADYLYMNWFASFGAKMFTGGDYTKPTINTPAGVATARFWQDLAKSGYIPPESPDLVDDDAILLFWTGKVVALAEFPGWENNMQAAIDSKALDKPFNYKLIRFPAAPGVTKVPASMQGGAVVAWKGSAVADRMMDKFVDVKLFQSELDRGKGTGVYLPIKGTVVKGVQSVMLPAAAAIAASNGLWDQGQALPKFSEMRKQWFPIFAELLRQKITPEDAIAKYSAALKAVIDAP